MSDVRIHFYIDVDLVELAGELWDTPLRDLIDFEDAELHSIDN